MTYSSSRRPGTPTGCRGPIDREGNLTDKARLLEACDRFRDALISADVQALDMLMADEYVGFDPDGNPQDKKAALGSYQPGAARIDRYEVEDVDARVIGEVGIVTGRGYIHGTFESTEFEHSLRFLDLYVYRDDRWQLYVSQVTPLRAARRSG